MPLMELANCENGPTTFVDDTGKCHVLGPRGSTTFPDTLRVSTDLLEDAGMLRALESGSVEVVEPSQDVTERLSFLRLPERRAAVEVLRERARTAVEQVMDRKRDRDLLGATCIGPADAGRAGQCGAQVIQRSDESGQVPPLCSAHRHLVSLYVATEKGSRGSPDDPRRTEWVKIAI